MSRIPVIAIICAALAVVVLGCPRSDLPPEPPVVEVVTGDYPEPPDYHVFEHEDGSPGAASSPCGLACANFAALGCAEGATHKGVSCYRGCLSMARVQRVPATCWREAKTREAVRACGGVRCLEPLAPTD